MFTPSKYQEAIFDFVQAGDGHGRVGAVAGSGKTTTLVESVKRNTGSSLFVAFNKHIAEALQVKLNGSGRARTLHSIGLQTLSETLPGIQVEPGKYRKLTREALRVNHIRPEHWPALQKLVEFSRLTLTPINEQALFAMARDYNLDCHRDLVEPLEQILDQGKGLALERGLVDFTDMLWLPHELNLEPESFDFVFCDESQDFNTAQLQLVMKLSHGRLLFVGDKRQAIMAFAGADARSWEEIGRRTSAVDLPLSICYRCPWSHVDMAKEIVPQIEPAAGVDQGELRVVTEDELIAQVKSGDLVLCRRNAPLLKHCLRMLAAGTPARVRGRDIGRQLAEVVRQIGKGVSFDRFLTALSMWSDGQTQRLDGRDAHPEAYHALADQVECIAACYQTYRNRSSSADDLAARIEDLFADDNEGVWLSSIHRAKGLEADRVWILEFAKLGMGFKGQSPRELEQEMNLKYVALTRSRSALYLVSN